jgi:hypothetical protein
VTLTGLVGSGHEQVVSCCEFGNEPSGSLKRWETIELSNNWGGGATRVVLSSTELKRPTNVTSVRVSEAEC